MSMGLAVCGSKVCSSESIVPVIGCRYEVRSPVIGNLARRGLLLVVPLLATTDAIDSRTQLLQKYLNKSEENKAKNDKEVFPEVTSQMDCFYLFRSENPLFFSVCQRLDNYYKRNYKDYFDFVEGSVKGKKELTEAEKGMLERLQFEVHFGCLCSLVVVPSQQLGLPNWEGLESTHPPSPFSGVSFCFSFTSYEMDETSHD
ncbi:hypothetical protein AKJ16_DCAP23348 [Drosera capensis]